MAKKAGAPNKFIRVIRHPDGSLERSTNGNGYEIHGLHYHKKNRSYYRHVPVPGKPKKRAFLGRDLPEALQKFCHQTGYQLPWQQEVSLKDVAETVDRDNLEEAVIKLIRPDFGEPDALTSAQLREMLAQFRQAPQPPSAERLSDAWTTYEAAANKRGVSSEEIKECKRIYNRFQTLLKDKPISQLTEADVATWREHVEEIGEGRVDDFKRKHHKKLRRVLVSVRKLKTTWPFPEGLWLWLDAWQEVFEPAIESDEAHSEPMSPRDLEKLIAHLDKRIDRDERDGYQFRAMLLLACNCGLDPIDCCRLTKDHLKLSSKTPHLYFPRRKARKKAGRSIDRVVPLLPQTVEALKLWMRRETHENVFWRGASRKYPSGQAYKSDAIDKRFKPMAEAVGITETFKSLRNIPQTQAQLAHLPAEMADVVLGHKTKGSEAIRERYKGKIPSDYALPLVKRIGEVYFGFLAGDALI